MSADSPWVAIVLGTVACLALRLYVLTPFVVFSMLRIKLPAEVVTIDPAKEPLPDEVRQYFGQVFEAMKRNGFELVATIVLPPLIPNVRSIIALYVNRATGEQAMSALILATGGIETLKTRYVEFITRYNNGVTVQTNNSPELGAFKQLPGDHTTQFWEIQDLDLLCQLHRFLAHQHRSGRVICRLDTEFAGNAAKYVFQVVLEETLRAQVETGYLQPTDDGLRATPKGACIMGWQELWPIKAIRRKRRLYEAKQALAEFEASGGARLV